MKKRVIVTFLITLLSSLLIGCGGGSSSENVSTGVLSDTSAVSGIQYQTATQSGTTDSSGRFLYLPGEIITFSIGSIVVGQATAAANLNTFSLAGISPPLSSLGIPNKTPQSLLFQQAINISVFLQTLDEDADPKNGISIPKETITLASNVTIKFKQSSSNFQTSFALRQFISRCRAAGLWGGSRPIVKSGYAVNRLYAGLALSPKLYWASRTDSMTNGSFSGSTAYSYDNNGNLIEAKYYNSSNVLTSIESFTYDANGNQIQYKSFDANNVLQSTSDYSFDANGNLVQSKNYGLNSVLQGSSEYSYDVNGNAVLSKYYGLNNASQGSNEYSYDANGNQIQYKSFDDNNVLQWTYDYSFDANGYQVQSKYYGLNNVPQGSAKFSYDANGNQIQYKSFDANNVLQSTSDYSFDANGNQIQYKSFDVNNVLQWTYDYSYDVNGYQVQSKYYDLNNVLQSTSTQTYDENGFKVSSKAEYVSGDIYISTNIKSALSGWIQILITFRGYWNGPT